MPADVVERLSVYEVLLRKWQKKINLVSGGTLNDTWERHFRDSYQLIRLAGDWSHWVDLGSGAGFPGLVIGIVNPVPARKIYLIEADKRKAAFLQEVSRETMTAVEIHVGRIEGVLSEICRQTKFDVVSARGLAPMNRLVRLAEPALRGGALGLFLKGKALGNELTDLGAFTSFHYEIVASQCDPAGKIVALRWLGQPASPV
nr:16S rRNA (guanine(527)-N(7))-methyltransferase RsmG [Candidatus Rhodoblastus alkanivorans]